jgi:cytochrome c peroxidase
MKSSSGTLALVRVAVCVIAVLVAMGCYQHVKAQSSQAGTMVIPLRPLAPLSTVTVPPVFGLEGIVADKAAAIQLGKALFWDMQAGSDDIQACASCHFNAGADSRPTNEVNPGQAGGDNTFQLGVPFSNSMGPNYSYKGGTPGDGFGGYHDGDWPFHKLSNPNDRFSSVINEINDVSGSQGVFATSMGVVITSRQNNSGLIIPVQDPNGGGSDNFIVPNDAPAGDGPGMPFGRVPRQPGSGSIRTNGGGSATGSGFSPKNGIAGRSVKKQFLKATSIETGTSVPDSVFSYPDPNHPGGRINTRRTTGRNTPSVVDAVFNFRNFWDGRAQNLCNGLNPFGARDKGGRLMVVNPEGTLSTSFVAMQNSALCSQALGPILSSTEMSADGRDLRQVGKKLLNRQPLGKQVVDSTDSVLGKFSNAPKNGINTSYASLIQKAFLPEWWQYKDSLCASGDGTVAKTIVDGDDASCPAGTEQYSQMEYNFSLFWGIAIQAYESTLIADQTPFDKFLESQQVYTLTGDNDAMSYTITLKPGLTPFTISVIGLNPNFDMSDQDVFAFDDGHGRFTGAGVDGTIDYASGTIVVNFEEPPVSTVPIRISYSVGQTAMTEGQLRGLLVFQTKGRCVVCHGGPELSNAAVDTVGPVPLERMVMADLNVRVYDTGFYHIGVRPGAEDAGLAGADPVASKPLSLGEELRQRVCNDGGLSFMIPGRPGDGITQAPLSCGDDIARTGFFKTPQLRNVALTAPYFHNGGQLTLEQVVEFYNRGADFNIVSELSIMDPDIEALGLGLTLQEKTDLVDFLRNGLTDPRSVVQSAPFDHPQLFTPNGHPQSSGYPVQNDPQHPGQATNQLMEVPAVGAKGGKPLPTFLENLSH